MRAHYFVKIKCKVFITEATFGLPIYRWQSQEKIFDQINNWRQKNKSEGKASLLMGYALGKMQRILKNIAAADEPIYAHGAVYIVNEKLREAGFDLPKLTLVTNEIDKKLFRGSLILAPPSADNSPWIKKFAPVSLGYCSGWMAVRGAKNRRAIDHGFTLSDHADWKDLYTAIKATGAEKIFVTHGYTSVLSRWLNEIGIPAAEVKTMYGDDEKQDELDLPENPLTSEGAEA